MNITLPPLLTARFERTDGLESWMTVESGDVVLFFGDYEIARKEVDPGTAYQYTDYDNSDVSEYTKEMVTEFAAGMLRELFDFIKKEK